MVTRYYPAVIYRGEEGFGVVFPDLDGCVSYGKTVQEATIKAEEALSGHIALMVRDGDVLPDATEMDHVESDTDGEEVARVLVKVELPARWVRVNISMEENLLSRIDTAAKRHGMSRSGFLAEAARRMAAAQ